MEKKGEGSTQCDTEKVSYKLISETPKYQEMKALFPLLDTVIKEANLAGDIRYSHAALSHYVENDEEYSEKILLSIRSSIKSPK